MNYFILIQSKTLGVRVVIWSKTNHILDKYHLFLFLKDRRGITNLQISPHYSINWWNFVSLKQKQIADFPNKTLALEYVDKHKIAHHEGLVVDKEYSFHELFLKFANIKKEGGRNYASVLTKAAGDIYLRHFNFAYPAKFSRCTSS